MLKLLEVKPVKKTVSFQIEESQIKKLKKLADKDCTTVSHIIRKIVTGYLDNEEE